MIRALFFVSFLAAASAEAGGYVYGAVGTTVADPGINRANEDASLRSAGANNLSSQVDNQSWGSKILIGGDFTRNLAIEFGYVGLGTITYRAAFTGGGATAEAKASGPVIGLVARAPINDVISIFGKFGTMNATVKATSSVIGPGGVASGSASDTHWVPNFGAGVMIGVLRIELERFSNLGSSKTTGESDATMLSAGALFRF